MSGCCKRRDHTGRRIAVVYLTPAGGSAARRLEQSWLQAADARAGARRSGDRLDVLEAARPLSPMVREIWGGYDGFVFIMAVGIVVRLVAPLLHCKWCDPGVVVVDEGGNFAVSLVGGHWGEANRLAREAASCLGATPVVTTATDVRGKPAIDLLARQWGFRPVPGERVKEVNSALLAGERVVICSEWDLPGIPPGKQHSGRAGSRSGDDGPVPELEMIPCRGLQELEQAARDHRGAVTVLVTGRTAPLPPRGIFLRPPGLAAGIGCRRGVGGTEIEDALEEALSIAGYSRDSLTILATHEIKADEAGLLETAERWGIPLRFFDSRSLGRIHEAHPGLQQSDYVQKQLGVGGVCEPAALAAVPGGRLVLPKTKIGRVTVALAEAGWLWSASGLEIRRI